MPKLLLIQSTQYSANAKKLCKQKRIYLPGLAFPLLASFVPDNWKLEISIEVVDEIDFDSDADIVGIGAMGHAVYRAIDIATEFRKRGKVVFMGGYMPSIIPWFVDEFCDGVIIGDAEISLPELLKDFESTGKIKKRYDNPLRDLNNLPLPEYELLMKKKIGFMLPVQAGRGCPHLCSYCSIACVYKGRYSARPVSEVVRDIKRVKELGFRYFYLLDDNIIGNPKFLEELCILIKPLKMKWASQCSTNLARNPGLLKLVAESGCRILSLGIESISQEGLNQLNKNWVTTSKHELFLKRINEAGIIPATEMMIGTDSDTEESIRKTFDFVMNTKIPIPKFYILTPLPGSALYDEFKKQGRLLHEDYNYYTAT
ncbi:MAG: B12-binding domain-containing radical SAM protein, partial [Ignavibacteriae bacterium]|nr:B12-binding domain-containing radical SAM protein [Ignavibacteriota bacterium]